MDIADRFPSRSKKFSGDPQRGTRLPVFLMAPTLDDELGGIQQFTREVVHALKEIYGLSHVAALSYYGRARDLEFAEWASGERSLVRRPIFLFHALRLSLKWRPRLILSTFPGFAPIGVICARLTGARFVTVAHGIEVWSRLSFLKRQALCAADQVLAVSRFTAEKLTQVQGVAQGRITLFPNTVNTGKFFPGPKSRKWIDRLGIPADVPVLLTVARLNAEERSKGIEDIWRAMERVETGRLAQAVQVIAGEGSDLKRLRAEVQRRGLTARVYFTDAVAHDELPELYHLADAFVMPSTREGFGIVFLEAMASGVPVVAANAGGAPDALLEGKLGWLADPGSSESLAHCVEAALERDSNDPRCDPQFLRSSVEKYFGHGIFCKRLEMILEQITR